MQLWQDGLIAMLAAVGLASLLWAAARAVLFTGPDRRSTAVAVIPAAGDGADLEGQVRALDQLRRERGTFRRILLVDCGLSEEGRRLAALLAADGRQVALCREADIGKYLRRQAGLPPAAG